VIVIRKKKFSSKEKADYITSYQKNKQTKNEAGNVSSDK